MSPVHPFKYDAFISYSSLDRPWAKKLADDLEKRKLKVFYDRVSLDVGNPWEEQLDDSLDVAQHLIVLWSKNAAASEYVNYERTYFHLKARDSRSDTTKPPRREILIVLEEPFPKVLNSLQMIPELKEPGAYAAGIENLDVNLWTQVLRRVEETARNNSNALRILVVVLASNKKAISGLDFGKEYRFIGKLDEILPTMGISSQAELLKHYDHGPDSWCPFGDDKNIWTVLDDLKLAVSQATGGTVEIDWEPIGADFWSSNLKAAQLEASRLAKELSMVIIDPISLLDDDVSSALDLIEGCFVNTRSAVMVLTPFKMLEPSASLRKFVEARARSFATLFYQPPVPPSSPFANFGANVGDVIDMRRLVLITLGQYFGNQKGTNQWTNL